jgi:hypothetical protein
MSSFWKTWLGLDRPEISVTQTDRLERQSSGKLKRFVPLDAH